MTSVEQALRPPHSTSTPGHRVRIAPRARFGWGDVYELWAYRELVYFFVWRDVKVRYKQTFFGAAWAIAQPIAVMVVFTIFLHQFGGMASDGSPYPLFVFAALIPWTLFSQSVVGASNSLVGNANLISKVYFPRILLPAAVAISFVVDYVGSLLVLVVLMIFYRRFPGAQLLLVVPLTALTIGTALSVGIGLSAFNVRFRDVRYVMPLLVQMWLIVSPIAYPITAVPSSVRFFYGLNPVAGIVEGFRWAILGGREFPAGLTLEALSVTAILLFVSWQYFRRTQARFADVI